MKNIIKVSFLLLLLSILVACGNTSEKPAVDSSEKTLPELMEELEEQIDSAEKTMPELMVELGQKMEEIEPEVPQEEPLKLDPEKYGELIDKYCKEYFLLKGKYIGRSAENVCYTDIAKATEDISLCELIIDDEFFPREENVANCYIAIAELKKDISICENIPDLINHEYCRAAVWVELKKPPEICDTLKTEESKKRCHGDLDE
ncbi:hypothetical protein KY346_06395 [Candidatus Woesearchaeota archaeon]|nr:hypothetical protein [Candidatus Woesearchaeota archaeon]